jgi:molecular chaperone DnaK (HSP70)
MAAIGIDLGTTNSAVAIMKGRPVIVEDVTGQRTVPSAVGWDKDLEELVVGIDAKNNPDTYGTVVSIKRKMGTDARTRVGPHDWLPEQISAEILKVLKKQVEERQGEEVTEAVITVPAHFQMAAMAKTKEAGELAGLQVQQLLAEPSAAVLAYGPRKDEKILVYDLGGGTFDCTIIDFYAGMLTTLAVFGNNFLGGDDFDRRLVNHLVEIVKKNNGTTIDLEHDVRAWSLLKQAAENAKIEMSRKNGAKINIPNLAPAGGRPLSVETVIKTTDFNAMIRDLVEGSLSEVEKALNYAQLDKNEIDTVLLVGGSTYVPYVQQALRQFFGKEPNKSVNPDLAVAYGAAASIVQGATVSTAAGAVRQRHRVTVDHVPAETPHASLRITGRSSARSQLQVSGGAQSISVTADDEGRYEAEVPLKQGMNTLVITAVSPQGERATMEPEPIVLNPKAEEPAELVASPAPRLPRALSVSCGIKAGDKYMNDIVAVILEPQTELPVSFVADEFGTSQDNQQQLGTTILEGELGIAGLNCKLSDLSLTLPPNVPANEKVRVHFSVDENFQLTAELEVPSINRRNSVQVQLKSPSQQPHIFDQIERLYVRVGDKLPALDRAKLEQARLTLEDLSQQFKEAKRSGSSDNLYNVFTRLQTESEKLRSHLSELQRRFP